MIRMVLAATLLLCTVAQAEEIQLKKYPIYAVQEFDDVKFKSLADVPHDFAKHMPPEMYYWWAKAHNARQYEGIQSQPSKNYRITTSGNLYDSRSYRSNRRGRRYGSLNYNSQTFTREFGTTNTRGPVTIYNPYFR